MASQQSRRRRHVPTGQYLAGLVFTRTRPIWRALSRLESAALSQDLPETGPEAPIYVAGVARSGTTIVTEMLARHPDLTSHRYSDFPNVWTPYWRNWLAERTRRGPGRAVERAHRDRLFVTSESPEAVEELIWMAFFDGLHDPSRDQRLDDSASNPAFEDFYRDHIRKLVLVRGASRYLAKGNYNTTRLAYLHGLFPGARFVVPVRNPVNHIASLVKQDRLFRGQAAEDPRVGPHLARTGHFEFGPDKRCVHVGDDAAAREIHECWDAGRHARAWALYWAGVYGCVLDTVAARPNLAEAVMFLRYEDLCREPETKIDEIVAHCRLPAEPFRTVREDYAARLSEPDYYRPDFSEAELEEIRDVTAGVASRFGYSASDYRG